jgi:hypothetical protein
MLSMPVAHAVVYQDIITGDAAGNWGPAIREVGMFSVCPACLIPPYLELLPW